MTDLREKTMVCTPADTAHAATDDASDVAVAPFIFDVLTLFPGLFDGWLNESLLGKAIAAERLEIALHDFRAFATNKHGTVDDAPFGGGAGMVIAPQPVVDCLEAVGAGRSTQLPRVLLSPAGTRFDQETAARWAAGPGVTLLCGRYEGFDARVEASVDEVVSIGDYVLNGGEVAAMAIIEAVARLLPGVIGNTESLAEESMGNGLLEYPHYTRPRVFRGEAVPAVLVGGNHAAVAAWRLAQAEARTAARRPDLWAPYAARKAIADAAQAARRQRRRRRPAAPVSAPAGAAETPGKPGQDPPPELSPAADSG